MQMSNDFFLLLGVGFLVGGFVMGVYLFWCLRKEDKDANIK